MDRSEGKMSIAARSSRDAREERAPILSTPLEIANHLKTTSAPSREMDGRIYCLLSGYEFDRMTGDRVYFRGGEARGVTHLISPPAYTSDLNAAVECAEEHGAKWWEVSAPWNGAAKAYVSFPGALRVARAPTPACALMRALLKGLSDGAPPRHSPETPAEPINPPSNMSGEAG